MASLSVEIPYNLQHEDLRISDKVAPQAWVTNPEDHPMNFITAEVPWHAPEMERIFRAAITLHHKLNRYDNTPTAFLVCLEQAIIWERG